MSNWKKIIENVKNPRPTPEQAALVADAFLNDPQLTEQEKENLCRSLSSYTDTDQLKRLIIDHLDSTRLTSKDIISAARQFDIDLSKLDLAGLLTLFKKRNEK
jgi:hypothetical protein